MLVLLGAVLNLSHRMIDASPFGRSPDLLSATTEIAPLIWLTAVPASLTVAGLAGLRRCDRC